MWFLYDLVPFQILPGLRVVKWIEVHGAEGALFTVDTLRLVCTWFGDK